MTGKFEYFCYGFRICSHISIPELDNTFADSSTRFDLTIRVREGPVAQEPRDLNIGYNVRGAQTVLFHLPSVATFVIEDGREITILRREGADPEYIRVYLLGSVLGVAIHQREMFPLHASAVKTYQGVMAFSAARGSGKSTTAAALWHRGFEVVSDDILALKQEADGQVAACYGVPAIKLLPDALSALTIGRSADFRRNDSTGKFYLGTTINSGFDQPILKRVYFLHDAPTPGGPIHVRKITKTDSVMHLARNIYRPELVPMLNRGKKILEQTASFVSAIDCFLIERPRTLDDLGEMVDVVEQHITT